MDKPLPKVLLCFDFGMRKIGVAVGQTITRSASPLDIIKAQDGIPNWEQIAALIQTWNADTLVVGIPFNLDGSDQPITHATRKFARRLENHFHLPVLMIDERLTTKVARQAVQQIYADDKKIAIDSYAAKIILESWFRKMEKE